MAYADGTVVIDTEIDTDGIQAGSKEVEARLRNLAREVNNIGATAKAALNKQIDAFAKLNNEYAAQEQKVENLRKKVAEYGNQKIPTDEYREIQTQIEQATAKLNRLKEAQERYIAGGGKTNSNTYRRQAYDMEELANTIKYAESELKDLEDTGQAFKTATGTKEAMSDMAKLVQEESKLSDMNNRLYTSYSGITAKVEDYGRKIAEAEQKAAEAERKAEEKAEQKIAALNQKLEATRAKEVQASMEADKLKNIADNAQIASKRIVKLNEELARLKARQAELEKAGVSNGYKEYESNALKIQKLNGKLDSYKKALSSVNDRQNRFGSSAKKAASSVDKVGKSSNRARMGLGRMLAMSLMMSVAFRAFSAIFGGIKSGFDNLAQYSGTTNQSISMLWSSLVRLQNALATAFAPILTVIAPILTKFIDMLSTAASYVSMFFSFLSGKSTYTRAIAVQKNYAASLGDTASAAKDAADATEDAAKAAEDYLSPLDDINRFTAEDSSSKSPSIGSGGSGGGVGATGPMFEDVAITDIPILEKLKDILSQIFKPFKQAWEKEGKKTVDAAKYAFTEFGKLAKDVGKSMLEVWTNGTGTQLLTTSLQIVQAILITVGRIAERLDEAWNKNAVGTAIIQAIADIFQSVLDFINKIAWATAEWAASIDFYPLLDAIRKLLESISPLIEAIGNFVLRIYKNIVLPFLTWLIESAIPTLISVVAAFFNFISEHQWIIDVIGAALIGAFAASVIVPLIVSIVGAIGTIISVVGSLIAIIGSNGLIGVIGTIVSALGGPLAVAIAATIAILILLVTHWDTVKNTMNAIKDWIANAFVRDWKKEFGYLGEYLNAWFKNIKNLWDGIKQIFNGIITFVKGVFTGNWRQAWEGVRQIFAGVWNSFDAIVKAPINAVIAFINSFLYAIQVMQNSFANALNSMSISLPHWLEKLTGFSSVGFNVGYWSAPMVPYLAQGAVIPPNREFMAVLGDQKSGNNIEAPESLIRRIVREESGNGKGSTYNVTAQVNRRTLFDLVLEEGKVRRTVTGRNPFETV
jgi:phage-related protein/predicted  nucleic acid-binding Zn-ribbon protein